MRRGQGAPVRETFRVAGSARLGAEPARKRKPRTREPEVTARVIDAGIMAHLRKQGIALSDPRVKVISPTEVLIRNRP